MSATFFLGMVLGVCLSIAFAFFIYAVGSYACDHSASKFVAHAPKLFKTRDNGEIIGVTFWQCDCGHRYTRCIPSDNFNDSAFTAAVKLKWEQHGILPEEANLCSKEMEEMLVNLISEKID